jgi:hypothetical protein
MEDKISGQKKEQRPNFINKDYNEYLEWKKIKKEEEERYETDKSND